MKGKQVTGGLTRFLLVACNKLKVWDACNRPATLSTTHTRFSITFKGVGPLQHQISRRRAICLHCTRFYSSTGSALWRQYLAGNSVFVGSWWVVIGSSKPLDFAALDGRSISNCKQWVSHLQRAHTEAASWRTSRLYESERPQWSVIVAINS